MKTATKVIWDRDDIRAFEHMLKAVLKGIEDISIDKEDYEEAYNHAIDHMIDQLSLHREEY